MGQRLLRSFGMEKKKRQRCEQRERNSRKRLFKSKAQNLKRTRFKRKHRSISDLVSVVLSKLYKISCQKLKSKSMYRKEVCNFVKPFFFFFLGIEDFFFFLV